jgi:plastocyanin
MAIQKNQIIRAPKGDSTRNLIIAALVLASFFGAYRFAVASSSGAAASTGASVASLAGDGASQGAAAGGGGCCGGGGAPVEGSATVEGGVQKIAVDVSNGYNPNVIQLKAGVPTEITFGQSSGCTAVVQSSDLGFQEDLTSGPKTVKIKALQPGTYGFACGMNMVQGQIVVQ